MQLEKKGSQMMNRQKTETDRSQITGISQFSAYDEYMLPAASIISGKNT